MAESKVKIGLSIDDKATAGLKKCEQSLESLSSKADKLKDIQTQFDGIKNKASKLPNELKQIKALMSQMNMEGLDNTPLFTEMAERAGKLADAIGDARTAVNAFANDNFKLEAMAQSLQLMAGAAGLVTGAMGLLGMENDNLQKILLKVQSAMALLNSVQAIANVLNKDSALMLRIKQLKLASAIKTTAADTVATNANSVAIGANTVASKLAQKAKDKLNYTIAIGKALTGDWTGLLLVGAGALATYAIATNDSKDKIEEQNKAINSSTDSIKDYNNKVGSAIGGVVGKFKSLQEQYTQLKTIAEKDQFIKDNKKAFEQLGLAINNVTSAQKAFVENADKVIEALVKISRAKAAVSSVESMWNDYYNDERLTRRYTSDSQITNLNQLNGDKDKKAAKDALKPYMSEKEFKKMEKTGVIPEQYRNWVKKAVNDERTAEAKATRERIARDSEARIKEANALNRQGNSTLTELKLNGSDSDDSKGSTKSNNTKTTKQEVIKTEIEINRENLQKVKRELQQAVADFNDGLISKDKLNETLKTTNNYYRENNIKEKVGLDFSVENGFEKAKQKIIGEIDDLQLSLPPIEIKTELKGLENLPQLTDSSEKLQNALGGVGSSVSSLSQSMSELAGENEGLAKAALITSAIGQLVLSFATSMKGSVTVWDWIAGAVSGAAVLAGIVAQMQSFSTGGIVKGTSTVGDTTLIRANAGEMVLNNRQQGNLYKALDSGFNNSQSFGGRVTFDIDGTKLRGVLNNVNRKITRQS